MGPSQALIIMPVELVDNPLLRVGGEFAE